MLPKFYLLLLFTILYCHAQAQETEEFGTLTEFDKSFTTYDKDPEAAAVVLYEKGDYFFITRNNSLFLVKRYHTKIKILKEAGSSYGDISIPLLVRAEDEHDDITDIQAITHNNGIKTELEQDKIYPSNTQQGVFDIKFTFPRIKVGSILEYKYTFLTPFLSNLEGWEFQSSIPKLYSEFNASIPYNYVYNRTLVGNQELCLNEVEVEDCFYNMGNTFIFLCENLRYAMEDIPAFNYDEEFMLGASNYISRLDFELSNVKGPNGGLKHTASWEDVDHQFKTDKSIGKQLRYKGFFGRKIPDELLNGKDKLQIARNIYNFIRDYYTWNGGYGIYGEARVKEAFDEKKGNVAEINMSLINLLNAAGINADLMLTSTRDLGLPKKTHPTMADFNYVIAKVQIDGKDYFLDATSKFHPFGFLPFRALNHYGRVMDFREESYWADIRPSIGNSFHVRAMLEMNADSPSASGIMEMTRTGYFAIDQFERKDKSTNEEYQNYISDKLSQSVEVIRYDEMIENSNEKRVAERIQFKMESRHTGDRLYVDPFIIQLFESNPFLTEERKYPIDFGYPQTFKYQVNIKIPLGYEAIAVPEKYFIELGEQLAFLKLYSVHNEKQVSLTFELALTKSYFEPADYAVLKELFSQAVTAQNNSMVVFQKI